MEYSIITLILLFFSLVYFRAATHYNITDTPNQRSAHSVVTVRGGGVLYPFAFILFLIQKLFSGSEDITSYLVLGAGLFMLCTVSFIDDVRQLSSKIRLVFQFLSVIPLLYFLGVFDVVSPAWILNAFNFMDGINGMSGLYSLITLATLFFINQNLVSFTDPDFILYPSLASLVFLFFNFRKKAKCFMGDVGSMGVAFWIIVLIGLLIMKTGELKWILLLTVYGVETGITIMERIRLRENIMEAHRRHLYQLFVNDLKTPHLWVSSGYTLVQIIISVIVIGTNIPDKMLIPLVILITVAAYLFIKLKIKKQISHDPL